MFTLQDLKAIVEFFRQHPTKTGCGEGECADVKNTIWFHLQVESKTIQNLRKTNQTKPQTRRNRDLMMATRKERVGDRWEGESS